MTNQTTASERRRSRRFPAAELKAQYKVKRGLLTNWVDVDVQDFSEHGIALILEEQPTLKQSFTLKLKLKMDMGEISIDRIEASPKNKMTQKDRWRLGLEFLEEKSAEKNSAMKKQLRRIQQILEKHEVVNDRLKNHVI